MDDVAFSEIKINEHFQMNKQDYDILKEWFLDYADSFLSAPKADTENILLKKEHTLCVCCNMRLIYNDLNENDQLIALTAALLHDIGRFEQLKRYGTFSDYHSEDHALLGISILKELDILSFLNPLEAQLIITAVKNHNKAMIEKGISERAMQISQLLRDADKLDIWKVVLGYYKDGLEKDNPTVVHHLPPGEDVSTGMYDVLKNHKKIHFSMLESVIDMKLFQMGWIFDINSDKALTLTAKRGYIEAIYNTLPQTEYIEKLYQMMKQYLIENVK